MQNSTNNCLVCNHQEWKKDYQVGQWEIIRCCHCGFAKINAALDKEERSEFYSEENIKKRFKKKRGPIRRFAKHMKSWANNFSKRNKSGIFRKKVEKYCPDGGEVLDVGCGDGAFLSQLPACYGLNGIELSDYLTELANKKNRIHATCGDLLDTDFGTKKFDAITIISVIEHIEDPLKMVNRCYDIMNEGGVLMLKTVNYNCINRMAAQAKWTGLRPPDHVVYFDPSNLKTLLKKAGFKKFKTSAWPLNDNMYVDAWK